MITLLDSGPWLALVDASDAEHARCHQILNSVRGPLVTSWVVVAEVMHLLRARIGWRGQEVAWGMMASGETRVECHQDAVTRMHALMAKYRDLPMDAADASLVALAERLGVPRVFTLDSDFLLYRYRDRTAFRVLG